MISLKWTSNDRKSSATLPFSSLSWEGSASQCSRTVTFTVPYNPYDKNFDMPNIKLGDIISVYDSKNLIFIGTVTQRERTNAVGMVSFTARDYMHHLLDSSACYKFKNLTPEAITAKVCKDVGISVSSLPQTKINIAKLLIEDSAMYDIIIKAYRKAAKVTGKKYMPKMDGSKLSIIEKGLSSGIVLTTNINITSASYSETIDGMINKVRIYDENGKECGMVSNSANINKYGIYQATYTKEEGVNATTAAKSLLTGITKEANIEALGDIRALSGYSLKIKDKATGLTGVFYIESDSHTFENGTHMMSLGLAFSNTMEEVS